MQRHINAHRGARQMHQLAVAETGFRPVERIRQEIREGAVVLFRVRVNVLLCGLVGLAGREQNMWAALAGLRAGGGGESDRVGILHCGQVADGGLERGRIGEIL